MPNIRFVDCEFSNINHNGTSAHVLVSAAIGDIKHAQIYKLTGHPLLLHERRNIDLPPPILKGEELTKFLSIQRKIFIHKKNKPHIYINLDNEIKEGLANPNPSLNSNRIHQLLRGDTKIITFAGNTDGAILRKLGILNDVYSLECDDLEEKGKFVLYIRLIESKIRLASLPIGNHEKKSGRLLSLEEVHEKCCFTIHKNKTHAHDPMTDIIYTKCLFLTLKRETNFTIK